MKAQTRALVLSIALSSAATCLGGCGSSHGSTGLSGAGGTTGGAGAGTAGLGAAGTNAAGSLNGGAGSGPAAGAAGSTIANGAAGTTSNGAAGTSSDGGAGTSSADGGSPRLVPWQLEAEGTPPLVNGIYDRQENVHCRFLLDETGQLRCLPWALSSLNDTPWFSDASCTKRVYRADPASGGLPAERLTALPLPREGCAPQRYAVGTVVALPGGSPLFGGTPCAAIADGPLGEVNLVHATVGRLEAPARWAPGAAVDGPLIAGRVRLRRIETADGARFDDQLLDEHWSKPCHLVADGDQVYCAPPAISQATGVEGTTCAGTAIFRAGACDAPAFISDSYFSAPKFALGAPWPGPISSGGHGCRSVTRTSTADGPDVYFERGAPLGGEPVASSAPWQTGGTGRLRLRGLGDDAGGLVPVPAMLLWPLQDGAVLLGAAARYFDSVANTGCNPMRTPEGILRCLPAKIVFSSTTALLSTSFADDKCSEPTFFCPAYVPCPGLIVAKGGMEANGELSVTSLRATRPLTKTYALDAGGQCTSSTDLTPVLFALGADQTSWTAYAPLVERNGRAPDAP